MKEPRTNEFKDGQSEWPGDFSRREFLKLSAAAFAMAGLSACIRPSLDTIFTYSKQPEDELPGKGRFYATSFGLGGFSHGVLVETHEGRPTRTEGNPLHPGNLGAASAIEQAWVLSLYDPDRAQKVIHQGKESNWSEFQSAVGALRGTCAVITDADYSPSLQNLVLALKNKFSSVQWVLCDPMLGETGRPMPFVDFEKASTVVSIGSDFLNDPRFPVSASKVFSEKRPPLYVVETSPSLTSAKANAVKRMQPLAVEAFVERLWNRLEGKSASDADPFLEKLVSRIHNSIEPTVFLADPLYSKRTQSLIQNLNHRYGKDVVLDFGPSDHAGVTYGVDGLRELASSLRQGKIHSLFVLGTNPVYTAPDTLQLKEAFTHAPFSCSSNLYQDETSSCTQWFLPLSHPLESWGDTLTPDGRTAYIQPIVEPFYKTKSLPETLASVTEDKRSPRDLILKSGNFEEALKNGVASQNGRGKPFSLVATLPPVDATDLPIGSDEVILSFRADPKIYDGRFANHPWLQELPDPITSTTWENVILVSPNDAKRLGIEKGTLIRLTKDPHSITAPAWILPGQVDGVFTLTFGYGRTGAGSVGNKLGYRASLFWQDAHLAWSRAKFEVLDEKHIIAEVQTESLTHDRELIRIVSESDEALKPAPLLKTLYADNPIPESEKWGMVIDLDRCSGCSACMIACQSENNIPTVGREGVLRSRHMHWIRVDRYFDEGKIHYQPVPCMHCEKAPCEPVCPVGATVHGNGGLNQMIYNRCIGTRYCSNNCPYKVRRFNFLSYEPKSTQFQRMQKNPNVSVRPRGVMEKCTYCVQRINTVRVEAQIENRPIKDGEIKTACQQTCPTNAIVFGNLADETSLVFKLSRSKRNYSLLEELGTKPRTTYLAKIERKDA